MYKADVIETYIRYNNWQRRKASHSPLPLNSKLISIMGGSNNIAALSKVGICRLHNTQSMWKYYLSMRNRQTPSPQEEI